jgi:hypothetical protein
VSRELTICLLATFTVAYSPALAVNESTTFILHASETFSTCEAPQQAGLDCETVMPTIDVSGLMESMVYMYLRNYEAVAGAVCAFEWPATWTILANAWDCQGMFQVTPFYPIAPGPGPGQGMMMTAFNPIYGGTMQPIGRVIIAHPGPGCLSIIDSTDLCGDGCGVVDPATIECTRVPPENRGRICFGPGGYDACDPAATPVEAITWGRIKAQYHR